MNTKKIEVLNKAIQMLENGFHYNWTNTDSCNCGVVASAAIRRIASHDEVAKCGIGAWGTKVRRGTCPITGLRLCEIQQALASVGFSATDIEELEMLSNRIIFQRAFGNVIYVDQKVKENLIAYLRAWVSILEEQDAKEQPKEVVKTVYIRVAVPASISEQAKELIGITETIANQ